MKPCGIFQILGLMVVRKMLDMIFSQHDLAWLDDLLPEKEEKKKEDVKKKSKGKEKEKKRPRTDDSEEEEEVRACPILSPAGGLDALHLFLMTRVFAGQRSHLLQPLAQLRVRPRPQVLCPQTAHPLQRPRPF